MRGGGPALGAPLLLATALAAAGMAQAHEIRPCYLELRQTADEVYELTWKVPARGDRRLAVAPRLPERCRPSAPPTARATGDAHVERWSVRCAGGLAGQRIAVEGLAGTLTDALVRLERLDGSRQVERLSASQPGFVVADAPAPLRVARTYGVLGVEHILLGPDHLLFVLGLVMLVDGWRRLVATITAFTLAHSLTLAAATLGVLAVPQAPAEAVIALSIAFVAAEVLRARRGRPGLGRRAPWLIAFGFGLLHGFGFAGALASVGVPGHAVPLALLCFNLGVELGQLLFVAALLALAALARGTALASAWSWRLAAYAMGSLAAFWTLERVAGFWA